MEREKYVDESWKESVEDEKVKFSAETSDPILSENSSEPASSKIEMPFNDDSDEEQEETSSDTASSEQVDVMEMNFLNYVTSLGYQAMIFLGDIPNPITNQEDKNLDQAKFLIDTLLMLKEKTQGNLSDKESNLLNASVYELQMKYIEMMKKEKESND